MVSGISERLLHLEDENNAWCTVLIFFYFLSCFLVTYCFIFGTCLFMFLCVTLSATSVSVFHISYEMLMFFIRVSIIPSGRFLQCAVNSKTSFSPNFLCVSLNSRI